MHSSADLCVPAYQRAPSNRQLQTWRPALQVFTEFEFSPRSLPGSTLHHRQRFRQNSGCMQGRMHQPTREHPAIDGSRRDTLPCRSLRDLSFLHSLPRSMLRPQQCLRQNPRCMRGRMYQPTRGDQAMQVKLTTCQSLKCCDRRSRCARRPSW